MKQDGWYHQIQQKNKILHWWKPSSYHECIIVKKTKALGLIGCGLHTIRRALRLLVVDYRVGVCWLLTTKLEIVVVGLANYFMILWLFLEHGTFVASPKLLITSFFFSNWSIRCNIL